MAAPQNVPMQPFFALTEGYTIRFTALDATAGTLVAGVVISNAVISAVPGGSSGPVLPPPNPVTGAYTSGKSVV